MVKKRSIAKRMSAEQIMIAANRYILFHYPTMYTAALPRRLVLRNGDTWIVPIVLTHPKHGLVGEVGFLALSPTEGDVIGATPRGEVVAAGKKLREAKGYELQAAFLRPRAI
jgi:hypothetical protein